MFGNDVRAIIPQLAMSAGTMIALSCKEVVMGKHSSLGPIDPQVRGLPAHGIVEEFEKASKSISDNPRTFALWAPIVAKYNPTLIGECEKAIKWSEEMVSDWLQACMFAGQADAEDRAKKVVSEFGSHSLTKSHDRHISAAGAKERGVSVVNLEDDQDLQERVLTVHHACVLTLGQSQAIK
jgi:membrane-bound ClpP family serine protease